VQATPPDKGREPAAPRFSPRGRRGRRPAPGLYFVALEAPSGRAVTRLVRLR